MTADRPTHDDFADWRLMDAVAAAGMADDDAAVSVPEDVVILDYLSGTATAAEREAVDAAFDGSEAFRRHVLELARELEAIRPAGPASRPAPPARTWWQSVAACVAVVTVILVGYHVVRVGLDPGSVDASLRWNPAVLGHVVEAVDGMRTVKQIVRTDVPALTNQGVLPIQLHVTDPDADYRYSVHVQAQRAGDRRVTLLADEDATVISEGDDHLIHIELILTAPLPRKVIIELDQFYRDVDTDRARQHQHYEIDLDRP